MGSLFWFLGRGWQPAPRRSSPSPPAPPPQGGRGGPPGPVVRLRGTCMRCFQPLSSSASERALEPLSSSASERALEPLSPRGRGVGERGRQPAPWRSSPSPPAPPPQGGRGGPPGPVVRLRGTCTRCFHPPLEGAGSKTRTACPRRGATLPTRLAPPVHSPSWVIPNGATSAQTSPSGWSHGTGLLRCTRRRSPGIFART